MYELICPYCGHVRRSPFVRVHAVTRCGGCRRTFQVEQSQIRRRVGAAAEMDRDALADAAADASGSAVGLRALSMDESVDEDPSARSGAHELLDLPGHAAHAADTARRGLGALVHRARTWSAPQWAGVLAVLVVLAGLSRLLPGGAWRDPGEVEEQSDQAPLRPQIDEPAQPSVVLGEAVPVVAAVWQPAAAEFTAPQSSGALTFDALGWRTDAGGRLALRAVLVRSDAAIRTGATLHVMVSAGVGRHRLMRSSVAVPLLLPDTPVEVSLPAPVGMMGEPEPTVWLEPGQVVPDALPLVVSQVRVESARGLDSVRVSAVNPTRRYLRPTRFVVTATDAKGIVAGMWTIDYRPLIEPGARLELSAPVALGDAQLARWEATGVAVPAGGLSSDVVDWGH